MLVTVLLFMLGIGLLIVGAELLVRGSSNLAAAVGISPLVVGLTVVAFGTSSPELAVSVQASLNGQADLALGNVAGSNIVNILLILGISALITPLVVSQQLVRLDVPLMIAASVALYILGFDGNLGRFDGLVLFGSIIFYTVWAVRKSRQESKAIQDEYAAEFSGDKEQGNKRWYIQVGMAVIGLGMLIQGASWLVDGAVAFAQSLGVSELVIGLTVVAIGTSLPEVAISVLASMKGERDIAVGNVVGSNLFNILAVLGLTAIISPAGVAVPQEAINFDLIVVIIVAIACLPIFWVNYTIARWEGALFFGYFVAYTLYLLLRSAEHDQLPLFSNTLILFALPLTAVTLMIRVVRFYRVRRVAPE